MLKRLLFAHGVGKWKEVSSWSSTDQIMLARQVKWVQLQPTASRLARCTYGTASARAFCLARVVHDVVAAAWVQIAQ